MFFGGRKIEDDGAARSLLDLGDEIGALAEEQMIESEEVH